MVWFRSGPSEDAVGDALDNPFFKVGLFMSVIVRIKAKVKPISAGNITLLMNSGDFISKY